MSITKILKQAEKAKATQERAQAVADAAAKETEVFLEQALVLVRSVSDATYIMGLTSSKEIRLLAWKKAVILLGVTAKSLPDYILIKRSHISITNKEWDVECDWDKKEKLIIADCNTLEDLDILFEAFPERYREQLRQRGQELADACESREELTELYNRYEKLKAPIATAWQRNISRFPTSS